MAFCRQLIDKIIGFGCKTFLKSRTLYCGAHYNNNLGQHGIRAPIVTRQTSNNAEKMKNYLKIQVYLAPHPLILQRGHHL